MEYLGDGFLAVSYLIQYRCDETILWNKIAEDHVAFFVFVAKYFLIAHIEEDMRLLNAKLVFNFQQTVCT